MQWVNIIKHSINTSQVQSLKEFTLTVNMCTEVHIPQNNHHYFKNVFKQSGWRYSSSSYWSSPCRTAPACTPQVFQPAQIKVEMSSHLQLHDIVYTCLSTLATTPVDHTNKLVCAILTLEKSAQIDVTITVTWQASGPPLSPWQVSTIPMVGQRLVRFLREVCLTCCVAGTDLTINESGTGVAVHLLANSLIHKGHLGCSKALCPYISISWKCKY